MAITRRDNKLAGKVQKKMLINVLHHLTRRRKTQLIILLAVMLLSSGAEVVSLAIVLPFLSLLVNPKDAQFELLDVSYFNDGDPAKRVIFAASLFILATIFASSVRLVNLWLNNRIAASIGSDLSSKAFWRTLHRDYEHHVQINSSTIINAITTQVSGTVVAVTGALQIVTAVIVGSGVLITLIWVDFKIALSALVVFGLSYAIIALFVRAQLVSNSKIITVSSKGVFKSLQEGIGGIRDIILTNNQEFYVNTYRKYDYRQRSLVAQNQFLFTFPRILLEAVGMIGIAFLGISIAFANPSDKVVDISLLGAFAFGAQRLLPQLQLVYAGWSSLNGYSASVYEVLMMINDPIAREYSAPKEIVRTKKLAKSILLDNVSFRYLQAQPNVIQELNLNIKKGQRIGIIGKTGSGKSTLIDLVMGLLKPTSGKVLVDGVDINSPTNSNDLLAWRSSIAHVAQDIYLVDGSIEENIALGSTKYDIDYDRIKSSAAKAQIAEFIESLDGNYSSFVGERGVKLSGGQKQRIGLARALYMNASVVVLDEATSALDSHTELKVMKSLEQLGPDLTIISVAHRLTTLSNYDRIIELKDGKLNFDMHPSFINPQGDYSSAH